MKNLILVRHAKSSWDHDVNDDERPLAKRGTSDAHLVSKEFSFQPFQADMVFSSHANRALTTCKIFLENLKISDNLLVISHKLYDFRGENVIDFIKSVDDRLDDVMIFGHNYAFTSVSNHFGSLFIDNLPTCGLVWIQFDANSWKDVKKGTTKLIIRPKDLKN